MSKNSDKKEELKVDVEKISAKDFVESNPEIGYKDRVIFVLDKKYPNQLYTFVEWNEILVKEDI